MSHYQQTINKPLPEDFHSALCDILEWFDNILCSFEEFMLQRGESMGSPGSIDSKPHLGHVMANQIYDECHRYYTNKPDSTADAICWLQKAFVLCRMFESEKIGEKNDDTKVHVGKMRDSEHSMEYGDLTKMSYLSTNPEDYGVEVLNDQLHIMFAKLINQNRILDAIRLMCDSPKHGVLSSMLNLLKYKNAAQIYWIGLRASGDAINLWLNKYQNSDN